MKNSSVKKLTFASQIAALYAVLTLVFSPVSFGPIQLRVAELLCILPYFFPFSSWGLFTGCLLVNIIGGNGLPDIVFGSLATLAAAFLTSKIRYRPLAVLPPVMINAGVVGAVLAFALTPESFFHGFAIMAAQVGAGELAVMYILGLPALYLLPKLKQFRVLQEKFSDKN